MLERKRCSWDCRVQVAANTTLVSELRSHAAALAERKVELGESLEKVLARMEHLEGVVSRGEVRHHAGHS